MLPAAGDGVAWSPDGTTLATACKDYKIILWDTATGIRRATLEGHTNGGLRVMTSPSPSKLWAVGTWREERQIRGEGRGFSPDGRLVVVTDEDKAIRLVETSSGRTVARLESPDSCAAVWVTFSPDGSRLVVVTNDGPAVHVWDLRAIRRRLVAMNLDWDAPAYPNDDPADPSSPPLPPLQVDLGPTAG